MKDEGKLKILDYKFCTANFPYIDSKTSISRISKTDNFQQILFAIWTYWENRYVVYQIFLNFHVLTVTRKNWWVTINIKLFGFFGLKSYNILFSLRDWSIWCLRKVNKIFQTRAGKYNALKACKTLSAKLDLRHFESSLSICKLNALRVMYTYLTLTVNLKSTIETQFLILWWMFKRTLFASWSPRLSHRTTTICLCRVLQLTIISITTTINQLSKAKSLSFVWKTITPCNNRKPKQPVKTYRCNFCCRN